MAALSSRFLLACLPLFILHASPLRQPFEDHLQGTGWLGVCPQDSMAMTV